MTPFHLRDRLKKLVHSLMGDPVASDPNPVEPLRPTAPEAAPPVAVPVPVEAAPVVAAASAVAPAPEAAAAKKPVAAPEPVAAAGDPPAKTPSAAELAKQAKHWQRTRKGMLKWLVEQGGEASMADMHAKSEAKFFVAHRSFSRLMEEFTGEELVTYVGGQVTLTEAGRKAV